MRKTTILTLVMLAGALCSTGPALAAEVPLADAAQSSDWARVQALLTKDRPDVNAAQADGMTALHWAAYHDHTESARLLLENGANAKAENRYGVTPLSLACTNGNGQIVRLLLTAGADPNTSLRGDETVLMTAARTGKVDGVEALLEAGAKVDATDRRGQTAIMWAAADGNADVVEALIKAGADPKARLRGGYTPMLFAVRAGRVDAVRVLLKAGIDPNEAVQPTGRGGRGGAARSGPSALILAIENGHFELAVELLKAGADPNDARSGYTPLHTMTWVRKPNRGEDDGQPPPDGSGSLTSAQFIRMLVKHGADVNFQLQRGTGGPGRLNLAGATPFLMASKTADLDYMKLLVELGADPKITTRDGATPLMAAAGLGTPAVGEIAGTEPEVLLAAQYLMTLGADPNVVDANGETAMHGAAYKNLSTIVEFLAANGAKIEIWNQKNRWGWTPLLIAQGFRPGNFKPDATTVATIERVMRAAGVEPPPTPPPPSTTKPAPYDDLGQ